MKSLKQLTAWLIMFFGISFIIASIVVILTLISGGSLEEHFKNEDGESDFWWFKAMFWVLVISVVTFLIAGGKFSKIKFPSGYDEDE